MKKTTAIILLCVLLAACNGVFFYPDRNLYSTPKEIGLEYDQETIDDGAGPKLVTWLLRAENSKALIVHLHGNAENMSSHIGSVYWLPSQGYDVLLADYRGYGGSEGNISMSGINDDVARIFRYAKSIAEKRHEPLILFGQSLGGSLGLYTASLPEFSGMFDSIITESAFSDYRAIAYDKIAGSWVTLVLGSPFLLTISGKYSPLHAVPSIKTKRMLFVAGELDPVVDIRHTELLFAAAPEPKEFWKLPDGGHADAFKRPEWRQRFLEFLDRRQ